MKRVRYLFSAIFAVILVLDSWSRAHAKSEITLLASVTAREPIDKIVANFQAKTS